MYSFTWTTWPEGLALCPLNHTQLDKLIYATKICCVCTVHIRQPRTHETTYTWQHVTPVHAQVPVWYVRLEYERNHTWLDCICIWTCMLCEQVAWQHVAGLYNYVRVAGIQCLHCSWLHWLWTAYDHVHWTVYMYSCSLLDITAVGTDIAITSREHCRHFLSDLRYFEKLTLFTLSTHKYTSFIHSKKKPVVYLLDPNLRSTDCLQYYTHL